MFTMMEAEVEPLLHCRFPDAFVERVEVPSQLSTTVTTGMSGDDSTVKMPFMYSKV